MSRLSVIRDISGAYHLMTYYLICEKTRKTIVIDPGGDARDMAAFLEGKDLVPEMVLMTHGHADPDFSMETFKGHFDIPYAIHEEDDRFFKKTWVRQKTKRMVSLPPPYPADIKLNDNDTLELGRLTLQVIHTPGHTPGSVCYLCEGRLFTGDAIFVGEAGRVDLPGGDIDLLVESIRTRIMPLDQKTIIHPGHHHKGDPMESTLEKEIRTNIYITDFILDDQS